MFESIFLVAVIVAAIVLIPGGLIGGMLWLWGASRSRRQEDRWAYRLGQLVGSYRRRTG